jgi:hypothetical protein
VVYVYQGERAYAVEFQEPIHTVAIVEASAVKE